MNTGMVIDWSKVRVTPPQHKLKKARVAVGTHHQQAVPSIIAQLGERGAKAAIILSAGMGAIEAAGGGRTLKQAALDAARPHLLRILGPNCVGLLVPGIGLNASFAHTAALPGRTDFVSQSGALVTGVLDWANSRGIGFSRFISLGDQRGCRLRRRARFLGRGPRHRRNPALYGRCAPRPQVHVGGARRGAQQADRGAQGGAGAGRGACRGLAHLVADLPEIAQLDINPLLADSAGVIALDARIRAAPAAGASATDRLAIRPYPDELEKTVNWHGQPLLLRPIRPDDAGAHIAFFERLEQEDVRLRMFGQMRDLSPAQLARFTQIDYDREMAFIATRMLAAGKSETLGEARAVADPDNVQAEFAAIVRSDLKGQGLGALLMQTLIAYCSARGTRELVGKALAENTRILRLARSLGFECTPEEGEGLMRLRLPLQSV